MSRIWISDVALSDILPYAEKYMAQHLGITLSELGDDFLKGTMPVTDRVRQPMGLLHGGASAAFAETLGGFASHLCIDTKTQRTVGLNINTNHLKVAKDGILTGTCRPLHLGKGTHLWDIEIRNESHALVSSSRLTMAVLQSH